MGERDVQQKTQKANKQENGMWSGGEAEGRERKKGINKYQQIPPAVAGAAEKRKESCSPATLRVCALAAAF